MKILIGSPIRQKPEILKEFLWSIGNVKGDVDYFFYDDNDNEESTKLLEGFKENRNVIIRDSAELVESMLHGKMEHKCNNETHFWVGNNVIRVAAFKDEIMDYARDHDYDYLFLIDSDVLIYPETIEHLVSCNKDIIAEIYWTRWKDEAVSLPQVWLQDSYSHFKSYGSLETDEEKEQKRKEAVKYIFSLKTPGLYEVGGLGACTLISKVVLNSKVRFRKLDNLSWAGEDRHFCIRANALGFELWASTQYLPFHIYRDSDLEKVPGYKEKVIHRKRKNTDNTIALSMLVRNETGRYLEDILKKTKDYFDDIVILDDASDDGTPEMLEEVLKDNNHTIIKNNISMFGNEYVVRKKLWDKTVERNPDWILCLDADEVFEDKFYEGLRELINQPTYDWYAFRLYDFWDENYYREDKMWNAHLTFHIFLIRNQPFIGKEWKNIDQHCGRFPQDIIKLNGHVSRFRLKHLGWMKEADRIEKYKRYQRNDPGAVYGIMDQYKSILDPNPNLKKWIEEENKIKGVD